MRRKLALVAAVLVVIATIPFTGAFTSVNAERTVSVSVAGDRNAYLGLSPSNSPDGTHARISNGQLELIFNGSASGISGEGLNPDATTAFSNVYNVTNQGTQPVGLSVSDGSSHAKFIVGNTRIDDGHGNITLNPGETVQVDIVFTTGTNATLESLNSVTIRASAAASGGSNDQPNSGDGKTEDEKETGENDSEEDSLLRTEQRGLNTIVVNETTISTGETATITLEQTEAGERSGVHIESLSITAQTNTSLAPIVRRPQVPKRGVPQVSAEGNRTLSYVAVDHSNITDDEIAGAQFTVSIQKSAVDGSPSAFSAYRYHNGSWTAVEVTLIDESSTAYVYQIDSPGLSLFSMIWEKMWERGTLQQSGSIKEVTLTKSVDRDGDGNISNFDIRVRANTTLMGLDPAGTSEPFIEVAINGKPIGEQAVTRTSNGTYIFPVTWKQLGWTAKPGQNTISVSLKEDDRSEMAEMGVDTADEATITTSYEPVQNDGDVRGTTVRLLRTSTVIYQQYDEKYLAKPWWNAEARESANLAARQIRRSIKTVLPGAPTSGAEVGQMAAEKGMSQKFGQPGSRVMSGFQIGKVFLFSGTAALAMYGSIQKKAVAIHLDRSGYTANAYTELHNDLQALEQNSQQLQQAVQNGNRAEQQELLETRLSLLRDIRATLPTYQKGYHRSVARNAAGSEDLHAYRTVWRAINSLRLHVRSDYQMTRELLEGPQPALNPGEMPTHGWQLDDRSVIYDTLETGDDFTTYRINVPEKQAGESITIRLDGGNVDVFDAEIGTQPPVRGAVEDGSSMELRYIGSAPRRHYTIENAEAGTYYVAVRADGGTGGYRMTVDRGISVTPLSREGPDIQRPVVSLTKAPPTETLQTGSPVHVTSESSVNLSWRVWDDKTNAENLRYSLRVDNGTGFSDWSAWRSVGNDRQIETSYEFADGVHRVQLRVQDDVQMQAVRNVDIVVSKFTPQVAIEDVPNNESRRFFVRVLPDRRVDRVEFDYRPVGNSTWQDWRTINDTSGLGDLAFNHTGSYIIRARAVTLTGNMSEWSSTSLVYRPPDVTAPNIELKQAPARDKYENGTTARITASESVTVGWSVLPQNSPISEIEYRLQTNGNWSEWRALPENGSVEATPSTSPGTHTVRIQVRDAAGNTNSTAITYHVDQTAPATKLNATGGLGSAVLYTQTTEAVSYLEVSYRVNGSWKSAAKLDTPGSKEIGLPAGVYPVRVRAVDYAGNIGPWTDAETVEVFPTNSGSGDDNGVDINESAGDGGTIDVPGESLPDAGGDSRVFMNLSLGQINGELLLHIYLETREGRDIRMKSIRFTVRGNQTVAADLPRSLENGTRLKIQVDGNGTATLKSLRAIDATPPKPPLNVSPSVPTVGQTVNLETSVDKPDGYIQSIAWNLTGDATPDRNGTSVTWAPTTAGNQTISVTVTDIFGATSTNETVISVNAPPQAAVTPTSPLDTPVQTGEKVTFSANSSSDREDELSAIAWDIDNDTNFERTGDTVSLTYADDGTYSVRARVTDSVGATDTAMYNLTVQNRPPQIAATHQPTVPLTGESVTFDATRSSDPDGSVSKIAWDFDADGTIDTTGKIVSQAFEVPGKHTVRVVATDDDRATNATMLTVYVNQPPVARLNLTSPVHTDQRVIANANESTDPDGTLTRYNWRVAGDILDVNATQITRTFGDDGNYTVAVEVTDEHGATDTVSKNLTVQNRAPNAAASLVTNVPVESESTQFTAINSTDRDGKITTYAWDFDRDGSTDATGKTATHTFDQAGKTRIALTVTDDDGAANTTSIQINVNAAPEPTLSVPASVKTGVSAALNATASTDPDGSISMYSWSVPSSGALKGTGPSTTVSFPDDGRYPVTITVTDDRGTTRSTTVNLTVLNREPNVSFSVDRYDGEYPTRNESVRFTAAASVDSDGQITNTVWLVDGTVVAEGNRTVWHSFDGAGNHTVRVRVTDDDGATNTTTRTVHVNQPPIAQMNVTSPVLTGERITADAGVSSDPDGAITTYSWEIAGTNITTNGSQVGHVFADDGNYTVTLRATDNHGAVDTARKTVIVRNRPPTANASVRTDVPVVGEQTQLTAAGSTDRDGTVNRYAWDFDRDGTTDATGAAVQHAFTQAGKTKVALTVTDDDGATNTTIITVSVNAPPEPALAVPETVKTDETATLDATASRDRDGEIVSYAWSFRKSGTTGTTPIANVSFSDNGNYTVTLTVTDDRGIKRSANATLTVLNRPPNASIDVGGLNGSFPIQNESVTLSALASSDPDGQVVDAYWYIDRGEVQGNSTVTSQFTESGNHTASVVVTDDDGATNTTSRTIHVNYPPTAQFEPVEPIVLGEPFALDARNSTDVESQIVRYTWSAGNTTLATSTNASVIVDSLDSREARALLVHEQITLTATDAEGVVDVVHQNVTVRKPDLAVNISGPETLTVGQGGMFSIPRNTTEYTITNVRWSMIDTENVSIDSGVTNTSWTAYITGFETPGTKTVQASIMTGSGATFERTYNVSVADRLNASIITNEPVEVGEELRLDVNISDNETEVVRAQWSIGNQTVANTTETSIVLDDSGTYQVQYVAETESGSYVTASRSIYISPQVPKTNIYTSRYFGGRIVTGEAYSASQRDDRDNRSSLKYEWDVDNNSEFEKTGKTVDIRYDTATNQTIRVRVSDSEGESRIVTKEITINPDENVSITWENQGQILAHSEQFVFAQTNTTVSTDTQTNESSAVRAYYRTNGTIAWTTPTESVWSARHVQGSLYVRGENMTARLNPKTGTVVWSSDIQTGGWSFVVSGDTLFLSGEKSVTALNTADGTVRWQTTVGEYVDIEYAGPEQVYVQSYALDQLVALDRESGAQVWNRTALGNLAALSNGTLISTTYDTVAALNPTTGERLWTHTVEESISEQAIQNGSVYVATGWDHGSVVAISDGEVQWTTSTDSYVGSMAIQSGRLVFDGKNGLTAVKPSSGEVQWSVSRLDPYRVSLSGDTVITRGEFYRTDIATLDAQTGTVRWTVSSRGYLDNLFVDNGLYFGSEESIYRVNISNKTSTTSVG